MLTSLILFLCAQRHDTISYVNFGARTSVVLADLSKLTGQNLVADESIMDVPLTLRLDQAPVRKTLEEIAAAVEGTWTRKGDGYVLKFSQSVFEQQEAARKERLRLDRIKGINQWLAETKKEKDPGWQACIVAKFIEELGAETVANFGVERITVFGYPPTTLIHPFPPETQILFEEVATDFPGFLQFKHRLTISVYSSDIYIGVDSYAKGHPMSKEPFRGIWIEPSFEVPPGLTSSQGNEKSEKQGSLRFKISTFARTFKRPCYLIDAISPEFRAILLDPITYDPTRIIGEYAVTYATLTHSQLVASFDSRGTDDDRIYEEEPAESTLAFLHSVGASFRKDWVVANRPEDNETGFSLEPHQRSEKAFLAQEAPAEPLTLGQLAVAVDSGLPKFWSDPAIQNLRFNIACDYKVSADFFNILETLPASALAALQSGARIPVGLLPAKTREYLTKSLFSNAYLSIDWDAVESGVSAGKLADDMLGFDFQHIFEVSAGPDIANGASLTYSEREEPCVILPGSLSSGQPENMDFLAELLARTKTDPMACRLGHEETHSFSLKATPFSSAAWRADGYRMDKEPTAYERWPEEFKKALAKAQEDLKASETPASSAPKPTVKP